MGALVDVVDEDENNIHDDDDDGHDNHDGDDKNQVAVDRLSTPCGGSCCPRGTTVKQVFFHICVHLSQKSSPMRGNRHHR